ncbi:MAG: carnitine dehydratase, partial [Ilumatobacteraceae bacterium]|nr:carnitine dehydratase [Ilumatobacteraceae bacterium]
MSESASPLGEGLLAGVRVLDLSLLGPAALASHLVDFGAEVIKIEAPSGDYVREMTWPIVDGTSLMHLRVNRGKESLVLDLKTPEATDVLTELIAKSDVIIEAMRPGFLDKRGFTRERLEEINPKIVFCGISGYGATGPYRDLPSHGIAYDTWAGQIKPILDEQGFTRMPDQANIGIIAGPAFGAMAVLAALVRARTTGKGAHMEIAQSDAAAYFDWYRIETYRAYQHAEDFVTGNKSDDLVRRAPGLGGMWEGVRYQMYESSDGHVLFMASENAFWKNFCVGLGREDLYEQFPGSKYADHARGNLELQAILRDIFRTKTSQEWITFAGEHNTTIAPVNTPKTVIEDPQFVDRFRWTTVEQTGIEQLLFPLHMSGEEGPVPTKAPEVGEHSADVLRRVLGYD